MPLALKNYSEEDLLDLRTKLAEGKRSGKVLGPGGEIPAITKLRKYFDKAGDMVAEYFGGRGEPDLGAALATPLGTASDFLEGTGEGGLIAGAPIGRGTKILAENFDDALQFVMRKVKGLTQKETKLAGELIEADVHPNQVAEFIEKKRYREMKPESKKIPRTPNELPDYGVEPIRYEEGVIGSLEPPPEYGRVWKSKNQTESKVDEIEALPITKKEIVVDPDDALESLKDEAVIDAYRSLYPDAVNQKANPFAQQMDTSRLKERLRNIADEERSSIDDVDRVLEMHKQGKVVEAKTLLEKIRRRLGTSQNESKRVRREYGRDYHKEMEVIKPEKMTLDDLKLEYKKLRAEAKEAYDNKSWNKKDWEDYRKDKETVEKMMEEQRDEIWNKEKAVEKTVKKRYGQKTDVSFDEIEDEGLAGLERDLSPDELREIKLKEYKDHYKAGKKVLNKHEVPATSENKRKYDKGFKEGQPYNETMNDMLGDRIKDYTKRLIEWKPKITKEEIERKLQKQGIPVDKRVSEYVDKVLERKAGEKIEELKPLKQKEIINEDESINKIKEIYKLRKEQEKKIEDIYDEVDKSEPMMKEFYSNLEESKDFRSVHEKLKKAGWTLDEKAVKQLRKIYKEKIGTKDKR